MSPLEFIMKILFTLLLKLISFSFSQEPINYETTLIEKGHLFYTKDTNKPYSGPVFSLYDDGKKKEEGSLKDGKMISKTKWKWYKNGQMWSEGNFKNDIKDGLWTFWYENGQKRSEGTYKNGKEDGLYKVWFPNGQKRQEGTYKDNIPISEKHWTEDGLDNGEFILYDKNGDVLLKGNLNNNKFDGEFIEYGYFGGRDIYHKRSLKNYRYGKLEGEYIYYFDTGDVNVIGNYKDGKLDGECTYYDLDGKIYWKGNYKDDVLVEDTSFISSKGPFRLN